MRGGGRGGGERAPGPAWRRRGRARGLTRGRAGVGERVEVDEVLLQIETDKVTIDVRAPEAGVVVKIHVAEDDTVVVGQAIASVDAGGGAPAAGPPAAAPAAAAVSHPAARTPSISFPARITPDGQRVSALPAAARAAAAAAAAPGAVAVAGGGCKGRVQAALGGVAAAGKAPGGWAPAPAAPGPAFAPPPGFAAAPPVRMGMSEEEIDVVDQGGTLP